MTDQTTKRQPSTGQWKAYFDHQEETLERSKALLDSDPAEALSLAMEVLSSSLEAMQTHGVLSQVDSMIQAQ
jgi:hypothetical protein